MKNIVVICPVYNEQEVIEDFYRELAKMLSSLNDRYQFEMLFVLDRGTDRTIDILRGIANKDSRVRVLALSARFGHQMSLLAGIDHADADAIIMMDSDLQHPPSVIPSLLEKFEAGFDVVFTKRISNRDIGFLKKLSSRAFYRIINFLSSIPIDENAADFRIISRRVAHVFQNQIRERNQFLRGLFSWVGFSRIGVSFQVDARRAGSSKYSWRRLFRFGVDGIVSFGRRPLEICFFLGGFLIFFGLAGGIFLLSSFALSGSFKASGGLAFLLTGLTGLQFLFLGVLGEYVSAVLDEVKARPHYIVEEKINFKESKSLPNAA